MDVPRGFISEDPGRNGANWYAYCGNNPVNAVDPSGRFAVPALAFAVRILAGMVSGAAEAVLAHQAAIEIALAMAESDE